MTDPLALVAEMEARLQGTKEALARIDQALRLRPSAQGALAACLNGDDQRAAELLDGLTAGQLYAIEGAASGLAIHASRLRTPAEDDGEPGEAGDEYDLDTDPAALRRNLDEVIRFLDGRGPKMIHDAVWARVRPVLRIHREKLAEQRHRAVNAEKALNYGAARLYKQLGDATRRAETAEADRDSQQRLAIKAELQLAEARAQVERWRHTPDRKRAADEIAPILGIESTSVDNHKAAGQTL